MGIISRLFGRAPETPPVVHDIPAPRDLDETFFDEKAQERVGKVISDSKKRD
jgi:hypothetical protein